MPNLGDLFVVPTQEFVMSGMPQSRTRPAASPWWRATTAVFGRLYPATAARDSSMGTNATLLKKIRLPHRQSDGSPPGLRARRQNAESFGWSKIVDRLDEIYSSFLKPEHSP